MESNGEQREPVPFRHRHDGWTPERQDRFLERLTGTGCVTEACRAVGLSTTSAYRAYHRMPEFAMHWNRALAARRPMLEDAAFERAVHGILVPLTRLGKVIGQRRHYSDGLLRFLLDREDRRERAALPARRGTDTKRGGDSKQLPTYATREETNAAILKKLAMVEEAQRRVARREAIESADRMRAAGKAP